MKKNQPNMASGKEGRSADYFLALFDNLLEGCQIIGFDLRYIYLNKTAIHHSRRTKETLIGNKYTDVWPGSEKTATYSIIRKCLEDRKPCQMENEFEYPDGSKGWFDLRIQPVPEGVLILTVDITARKQSEISSENQLALLSALINSTSDIIIFSLDTNYCYTAFNEAHRKEMKRVWNAEIEIGMSLIDCIKVTEIQELAKYSIRKAMNGESFSEIQHQPEQDIDYEFFWNPIFQDKHVVGITVFIRDITSLIQSEKKLKESEAHYRSLFGNMLNGFAYCRMLFEEGKPVDYIFLEVNKSFESLTGLKNVTGKKVTEVIPGIAESDSDLMDIYGRVALSGNPETFEMFVTALNHWFQISVYSPQKEYFIAVFDVITKRKQDTEALRQSEERYRNLLTNLDVGIVVHAPDTSIIMNNQKATILLGLSEEQMQGKKAVDPGWKFLHENNIPLRQEEYPVNLIIASKKPLNNLVLGVIRPNTYDTVWLTVNGFPVFNSQGEITEVLVSFIDFTSRKQAEKALMLKNLAFDSSIAANSIADLDGIITEANDAFVQIWGHTDKKEVVGKPIAHFLNDPKDAFAIVTALSEKYVWQGEYLALKKDGSTFIAYSVATCIRDDYDKIIGYHSSVIDITTRKHAEDAFRETNEYLENLINYANSPIIVWDPKFRITRFNHAFESLTGLWEDEILGETLEILFPPEAAENATELIRKALAGERGDTVEIDIRHQDGSIKTVLWSFATLYANDGETPVATIAQGQDITERKQVEQVLMESEQKFRDTISNLDEGFYSVTLDGVLLDHNLAFCHILGIEDTDDLKGLHLTDFWLDPSERKKYIEALKTSNVISNYQISIKTKDEEIKTVLINAHLIKDKDNRPLRIEGIFLDITERIRTEEALRIHADRLRNLHKLDRAILLGVESLEEIVQTALQHIRSLLTSQHTSIGILDLDDKLMEVYKADVEVGSIDKIAATIDEEAYSDMEMLLQQRMEIIEDMTLVNSPSKLLNILMAEDIRSCLNEPLFLGNKLIGALNLGWKEARTFTPDELEIAGEVAGQITIAIEQVRLRLETKRYAERMEQMVEERTKQLVAVNKELEAFSYSVSHDLRSPLRAIHGFTEILKQDYWPKLDDEGKRICDIIQDSSKSMGKLIDDLLSFSRLARSDMQNSVIDMKGLVVSIYQEITDEKARKRINLEIEDISNIQADSTMLKQVWTNLLSNAIKFSSKKEKAEISITSKRVNGKCIYCIKDNGAGFEMNYADKLFGVFQRLHSAHDFEGTGVGLAIVQRIVRRHGGDVWAEGEVDKGAAFYFSLPVGE